MLYYLFLFFCAFLPLQFALNPATGFDLASVRLVVPLLFLACVYVAIKNKKKLLVRENAVYLLLAWREILSVSRRYKKVVIARCFGEAISFFGLKLAQVIGGFLVNVVVQPVREQQVRRDAFFDRFQSILAGTLRIAQ